MSGESKMTRSADMLVEVGYPHDEIIWSGSSIEVDIGSVAVNCTYCKRNGDGTKYPAHDVLVIRHWKTNTPKDPLLGWWAWYCPEHYAATAPWPSSLRAPAHLIPADLDARIAANLDAAARAEAEEFGRLEQCIALIQLIPAGRWATITDVGNAVYGNSRSRKSVVAAMASIPATERCMSRVRNADGTCSTDGRDIASAEAVETVGLWNEMAREDGLHVVNRTGVAFAAYRMELDDLRELARVAIS